MSASIWRNEAVRKDGEPVAYYSVSLQRRYKDKEGNWKSGSLRTADLPKAMLVLQKAYEYLVLKGDEPDEDVF
ncbi:hypothetical protein COY28_04775 [Candidatus Woesearchaeota archaeon CG_4_10_14_0_2_um_filter_57_5]|nr:MAG: hypothetical protein COV94_02570 [Candidatus Woesearchaeota archaeon CG11_big_fil_rev_8_21_14_0_20_57_5]PIZ51840.1 MAG: hypothetical protein COY28_04775 [Candidatus Woesearchaeota archaeon CG_4_10_14_0_2_um_filter_57_5]